MNGKRLGLAVGVLSLLALATWWAFGGSPEEPGAWSEIERGDLVIDVEVTGTLQSIDTSQIGPPQLPGMWQFKIARMAPEGDEVRSGTPVLEFDSTELRQKLQQQTAELDAAEKRVEKAERERAVTREQDELGLAEAGARLRKATLKAERPTDLTSAREQSHVKLDLELAQKEEAHLRQRLESSRRSTEASLAVLKNQRDQAASRVAETRRGIEALARLAPRDGTVIYTSNWEDQKKKVGDSCWRGEHVMELPDLSRMKAVGQVHEADAGRVVEGQKVTFRLDAHPDTEFSGHVASIWRTVQRDSSQSQQKVVRLDIELEQTDTRRMRPGMRLRGRIEIERFPEVLLVDGDAIFLRGEQPVVYRQSWLGSDAVPVKLGRRDGERVEVLEGLSEGERIALRDPGGEKT